MNSTRRNSGGVGFPRRGGSAGQTARRVEGVRSHYTTGHVRRERTGWRDQALSERHRSYGFDCPMLDLDFVACEYDTGTPICLVEYKHEDAMPVDLTHASYRVLRELADRAHIPFIIARYNSIFWSFEITPANPAAYEWFLEGELLTELRYVERLYAMRGRKLPPGLEVCLNDVKPEEVVDDET